MSVGGGQNFDELLKRLSQVKSLPDSGQPFRTQQNIGGAQLRDAAGGAFRNTPSLADSVAQITAGNQAPTGVKGALYSVLSSAPAKAVLGGLTVIDTPRRAIISTIKEIGDALDSDPNTKARAGDWFSQTKDPTFGWGRVRPGKGWGGRIEGFIGDVLLDPLTYLTFGGTVAAKSVAQGAGRAAQVLKAGRVVTAGADDVSLRGLLGTKTVAGREGRFALAEAVRKYGGDAEEIALVAARGKSAVPDDIARALGLQKSGLYMFGSRVRLPGSGRLGKMLEKGVVGSRLGIMNTNVGKKLSYLYTPRGTGFTGDLSKWRADVASGRLEDKKVGLIFSALNGAESARTLGNQARADELRRIVDLFGNDETFKGVSSDLHKIIEKPDGVILSAQQQAAKQKVELYLDDVAERITMMMREVEPSWSFDKIGSKYVPHILTDKARRVIEARLDEPWAQRLEQYLAVDVMDMKGNLQSRRIRAGMEDFLGSGKPLEDGSIEGINKAFREATGEDFDLFETDMMRILGGYADTVRGAAETTALMRNLANDDFIRVLSQSGHIDPAYLSALKNMVDEKWDVVAKNLEKSKSVSRDVKKKLSEVLGSGGSVTQKLLKREKALAGQVDDLTEQAAKSAAAAANLVPLLEDLDTVVLAQVAAVEEISRLTVGASAGTTLVKEHVQALQARVASVLAQVNSAVNFESASELLDVRVAGLKNVADEIRQIDSMIASNELMLQTLQQYGDTFVPELERIFNAFRQEAFEDVGLTTKFAQTTGNKSTDNSFNQVLVAVQNPFSLDFVAKPTGKNVDGISDPWVQSVVTTEGTPEYELLNSIPDLGTTSGKAQRVSMGSTREDARALTLAEAREILVRASVTGTNPEEVADAFYFLTLRELRATSLNAGTDVANQRVAQSALAQELLDGATDRAKAWQAGRKAVQAAAKAKQQFELLASERAQLGKITVAGKQYDLAEDADSIIPALRRELHEAETAPADATLRGIYDSLTSAADSMIVSGKGTNDEILRFAEGMRQFFDLSRSNSSGPATRTLDALNEMLGKIVKEGGEIDREILGTLRKTLERFSQEYLTSPEIIMRRQSALNEALSTQSLVQASNVSQRAKLSEQVLAKDLREAGDILVNYSVYHNARIALDHVARLLPAGVEISDSLLRFAFAGSARQHGEYVTAFIRDHSLVSNLFRTIESEMVGVSYANRAGWLKDRLARLTESEFRSIGSILGDLSLVAESAPRDLRAFRPNQPQYAAVVKRILDRVVPGWDNPMTSEISAAVKSESKGVNRAGIIDGSARTAAYSDAKDLGKLSEKTSREMQGAFQVEDAVANRISNLRKISPKELRTQLNTAEKFSYISKEEGADLLRALNAVEQEVNDAWAKYKLRLKEKGYTPKTANQTRRALKNAPGDSYGLAALWAAATKTRADGSTQSNRAINDFFAYLFGNREVLVMRGGKGQAAGPGESLALEGVALDGTDALRTVDFESAGQARKGVLEQLKEIRKEARQVRSGRIERMAYIAAKLGLDGDEKIRSIMDDVVSLDNDIRIARFAQDEDFLKVAKARNVVLQKEFDEAVEFAYSGVTPGERSPDIYKFISVADSHMGKTKDVLSRKLASLQELIFSPDAGLANIDSLRFGLDNLDDGRLTMYRVRYLRGLSDDLRKAIESVEATKKELSRIVNKNKTKDVASDFDLFAKSYGGDREKYGQLVRWIEATENAIKNGDSLPTRPAGLVIPARVANNLAELRRARQALGVLTQGVDFHAAKEAQAFNHFLRELSQLNLDPQYLDDVVNTQYRYDILAERALRRQMGLLSGGLGVDSAGRIPEMSVAKAEEILFDDRLMGRFMEGDGKLDDIEIIVRVDYGVDEVADKRAVVDFVRSQKKQKFEYSVRREKLRLTGDAEVDVVVYEDLTGPVGTRTSYTYRVSDVAGDPQYQGGLENGLPKLVLDTPVYARYSPSQIYPIAGSSGVLKHYDAMKRGNPVSAVKYTDMSDNLTPKNILVSGNAEAKRGVGSDFTDFSVIIDPNKTYVFYNLPGQKRKVAQRLSDAGLPPQENQYIRPSEIFMGEGRQINNERLASLFAKPLDAESRSTTADFNKLTSFRSRRNDLQKELDLARFNNKKRQEILVQLEQVEDEIRILEKSINAGSPRAINESRAVAFSLWERFKQPDVVGFLTGKKGLHVDDAEDLALDAFRAYVKYLHEFKISKTLDTGEVVDINPFIPDADVYKANRAQVVKTWNSSPDAAVMDRYSDLNTVINGVVKDLNVVKNGGEANDLVARYVSVMEQLRVAERQLTTARSNVASEMFVSAEAGAVDAARKGVADSRNAVVAAREDLRQAENALREAQRLFVPIQPLKTAETNLNAARRSGNAAAVSRLEEMVNGLRNQQALAQEQKTNAIGEATRRVDEAKKFLAAREAESSVANAALRGAGNAETVALEKARANIADLTPEDFDEFVKKEIESIVAGKPTNFAVTVSAEKAAAARATIDELSARREELLSTIKPELQAKYAAAEELYFQADVRHGTIVDELNKIKADLARIEGAEARGGALPFGGQKFPPEYVALKNAERDAIKKLQESEKRLEALNKQSVKLTAEVNAARAAGAETNTLLLARDEAQGRLSLLQNALGLLGREDGGRPRWVRSVNKRDWDAEFEDVSLEVESVLRALNALPTEYTGRDLDRVWASWTKLLESRAAVLLSKDDWEQAVQLERLGAAGVLNSDNMIWSEIADEGFVKLEGSGSAANFTKLQMRPEVADILSNMGRIKDGAFARQMRRWMLPYTKFFKAWALATPGFHIRNSITNGFMMIAAGGDPRFLYEAMIEYNALHKFLRRGKTFEQYMNTLTDPVRRQRVSDAYDAMMGSGVGQAEEFLFDTSGKLTNNPITRTSRRLGTWVESHSRFMLAYDGIRQGYDKAASTARVRRFLFDYEDVSKLDANMRQIVPFWTWTSRNVPLTIQNVYLNPRPYQIYQSFKRNVQDDERTAALPQYMREAGGFALAGTNFAVTPELGFNRLQADVSMLSDPLRVAANVNPVLRVPAEVALANKSFFRNREFNREPIPVSGPVGSLASLLGSPIGMGQSVGGQQYVDEKLLYALTNLVPQLNQAERFIPSQEYYQQRGSTNPLLGYLGSPLKEVTPEMTTSEQRRRLAELQKLLGSQPRPVEE